MTKIALITGGRSDRNALRMVEKALAASGHDTYEVPLKLDSPASAYDAAILVSDSIRRTASFLNRQLPNLVVLHGDRYEILGAAVAVNIMGVPIAHIGGGDLTEGSQDDCFRHAITKFSHLHFPSNQDAADRIIQMGEDPSRVHIVGDPGIDMVVATPTLGRDETFAAVGLDMVRMAVVQGFNRTLLVLFHPNTLGDTASELASLSGALEQRGEAIILLGPNADAGGDLIRREWKRLAATRPNTVYHDNVSPNVFYSLMKWCDVMVGNSSAALIEAPCFGIPVIDLGDRQNGRPIPDNTIGLTGNSSANISETLRSIFDNPSLFAARPRAFIDNFYGDGHAAERIAKVIGKIREPKSLLRKKFHYIHVPLSDEDEW
jgi:UDP-hydrolysing UDP-N-acetyl-D-glucosamine 2-epimerase